ncbi:uncharacterized protein UBRO_00279 [Ustilago bromivora]|uniref:Uncharacterized protein n=1 Tax=Ustilago bromivora TaxID=307758 RepID=A0A1K0FXX8_9BASI|nr:uncharacterized protein UBRO_00279 [Ustilago bromivora]
MTDTTHFTFGSKVGNVGFDNAPSTSSANQEFTFTSDRAPNSSTESGYLDDEPAEASSSSSKRYVNATTLFSHLAQRQFEQQQQQSRQTLSQAEYDDPSSWSHSPSSRFRRNRAEGEGQREDSEYSYDSDSEDSYDSAQLQKEWEEQLDQLKLMFQIIIFPFVGKFMGRKFSFFLFDRYRRLGSPFGGAFWRGITG